VLVGLLALCLVSYNWTWSDGQLLSCTSIRICYFSSQIVFAKKNEINFRCFSKSRNLTYSRFLIVQRWFLSISFLPRDAMLAQYMLWPCVCLSVSRSVCLSDGLTTDRETRATANTAISQRRQVKTLQDRWIVWDVCSLSNGHMADNIEWRKSPHIDQIFAFLVFPFISLVRPKLAFSHFVHRWPYTYKVWTSDDKLPRSDQLPISGRGQMAFDPGIWHDGSPWPYLGPLPRSRPCVHTCEKFTGGKSFRSFVVS